MKIPYATLLDLDIEREGGGWGRIKYALKQLLELDKYPISVLKYNDEQEITDEELEKFHEKNESIDKNLLKHLEENFGVFYSQPLDIDMMMLSLFLAFYKSDSGLRIPDKDKDEDKYNSYIDGAKKTVLRDKADLSKYPELKELEELLPWYRYLFLGKSKPSTHIQALCKIESSDKENLLRDKMPPVLKRLLKYTNDKISADKTI